MSCRFTFPSVSICTAACNKGRRKPGEPWAYRMSSGDLDFLHCPIKDVLAETVALSLQLCIFSECPLYSVFCQLYFYRGFLFALPSFAETGCQAYCHPGGTVLYSTLPLFVVLCVAASSLWCPPCCSQLCLGEESASISGLLKGRGTSSLSEAYLCEPSSLIFTPSVV